MIRLILLSLFLITSFLLSAQDDGTDTTAYTFAKYEVKKPMKISALAEKLQVDAALIVKLNKFRSVNSGLIKGQRIKVPVYIKPPKTEKSKPEKKKEERAEKPAKVKEQKEQKQKEPKPGKKEKKVKEKPVKEKESKKDKEKKHKEDKPANNAENTIAEKKVSDATQPLMNTSDYERNKVRLIMIDATLELNEAIMEGVKASLDSLDTDVSKKDSSAQAKRTRDRTLLMPYILHIQDSLSKEITSLKAEKSEIENRIDPPTVTTDTVISDNDIIIYEVYTYDSKPEERTIMKIMTKVRDNEVAEISSNDVDDKKIKETPVRDTAMMYDIPAEPKKNTVADNQPLNGKASTLVAPKALQPVPNIKEDTSVALIIPVPNSSEAFIIKPIVKQPAPESTTVRKPAPKTPLLSSADSVRHIKAEFFLKRAQKAMGDKNYTAAEEYLHKSLELRPKYFDAWFALAETHDLTTAHQQALKEYQTCKSIDSTQPRLYFNIGNSYLKLKQKTEAIHYYNLALTLEPDNIPVLMARASILADWKSYKLSITDYDHVLKLDRLYYKAYKARGQVKLLTKDFSSAMDDFTRFLIFETKDPAAFYYRGLAKIGNNELLDGCLDLSTSADMGYAAAGKAIKKSCE